MKRKTKLAFEELARELKIVPERDLLNILGGVVIMDLARK